MDFLKEIEKLLVPKDPGFSITSLFPGNYRMVPPAMRMKVYQAVKYFSNLNTTTDPANLPFLKLYNSLPNEQRREADDFFSFRKFSSPAVLLTHDVEDLDDVENIHRVREIEETLGFRSSWNFIVNDYSWDESLVASLIDKGHEIGWHGFTHDNKLHKYSDDKIQNEFSLFKPKMNTYNIRGGRIPSWKVTPGLLEKLSEYFHYDTSIKSFSDFKNEVQAGVIFPYRFNNILEIPASINFDVPAILQRKFNYNLYVQRAKSIAAHSGLVTVLTHPNRFYLHGTSALNEYKHFLSSLKEIGFGSILPSNLMKQN